MGVYVFHARKSKKITVKVNGESKKVHLLQYTCRLSQYEPPIFTFASTKAESLLSARITKMENNYNKGDIELVALEHNEKFEDGLSVFNWKDQHQNVWFDCDSLPERVGTLKKVGNRYQIET